MENLARYVIRASFSQERMSYVEEDGTVVSRSKDGAEQEVFDAPEWLVCVLTSPIRESRWSLTIVKIVWEIGGIRDLLAFVFPADTLFL